MIENPRPNILVTSAGNKIPLLHEMEVAVKKTRIEGRVVACDSEKLTAATHVTPDYWHSPKIKNHLSTEWIDAIQSRAIGLIMPTRDGELSFWASQRNILNSMGVHTAVSAPESVNRCIDKLEFAKWASDNQFPVIPALNRLDAIDSETVVLKERFGSGSKNLFLNLSSSEIEKYWPLLSNPIVQPFIHGAEISIDAYVRLDGAVHGLVLRRRDRVQNGESQITTTFRDDDIEAQASEFISALNLRGPVVLQAIVNKEGLHLIEVNPRFGGASTASIAVGLDSLAWMIHEAFRQEEQLPPFVRSTKEMRNVRYSSEMRIAWS